MGLTFNKVNTKKLIIPHSTSMDISDAFSYSGWINITTITLLAGLLYKGNGGTQENYGLYFGYNAPTSTELYFEFYSGGYKGDVSSGYGLTTGEWIYVTVTHSASDGLRFYKNAVLVSTHSVPSTKTTNTQDALIGHSPSGDYFIGSKFDIRLYDRILTPSEIEIIYNSRGVDNITNGLRGRWAMNGPEGGNATNPVLDLSGNGNNATPQNNPIYIATPERSSK